MNIHPIGAHAVAAAQSRPRFLMCPPRHFAVSYSINPWMDPQAWASGGAALHDEAARQWRVLRRALAVAGAAVEIVEPQPGLPDLVFTANAAVVLDRKAVLARFRHGERQREEPAFAAAFAALAARGLIDSVCELPGIIAFEGAGDCIFDARRGVFWMGCGFRSDASACRVIAAQFAAPCVALPLADPRFYHLDTAFCALPCGAVIYYPPAFAPAALAQIHDRVAGADRIALDDADATRFAANAVCVGRSIILSSCGEGLRKQLAERGYRVVETPLHMFLCSGGSACCLTLRLDHWLRTPAASAEAAVAPARQRRAGG